MDGSGAYYGAEENSKLVFSYWGEFDLERSEAAWDPERGKELIRGVVQLFEISGDDFVADAHHRVWKYAGPLDDLQKWLLEEFAGTEILEKGSGLVRIITDDQIRKSSGPGSRVFEVFSYAHDLETAWRIHLGEILVAETQPYSILAADGQSLTELNTILTDFEDYLPDYMPAGNDAESALFERWRAEVAAGREVVGFRPWVRALKVRGTVGESPVLLSLDTPNLEEILAWESKVADPDPDPLKGTGTASAGPYKHIDLWGDEDE